MSIETLWSARFQKHLQNMFTYFTRMINGLLYSFIFLTCIGAYYYAQFLKTSPSKVISLFIIVILLTIILMRCPVRTFLQKPDAVYLLALEKQLTSYFKKALLYNYIVQLFPLLFTFLIITPLAMQILHMTLPSLCTSFFILILVKGWNVYIHWIWQERLEKNIWLTVRAILNVLILYTLFSYTNVIVLGSFFFFLVVTLLYTNKQPKKQIPWDYLIQQEEKMDIHFYQFASIFTDVPQLKKQIKQRKWLTSWIEVLLYQNRETFLYVNTLSFLRANDYFGLYMRLTMIGSFLVYFVPNVFVKSALTYCLLYMTSMQMRSLWTYFSRNMIVALYPIETNERMRQFLTLISFLASIQLILCASIILLSTWQVLHICLFTVIGIIYIKYMIVPKTKKRISSLPIRFS
ncbi:ABC transporter permease [Bacillus cytotoxicus]|uniref:ABC transporter permease n=1 Tax=Bacillus cytotoxicus TaxID=580165 RepID=UPI003D7EE1C6